MVGHFVVRKVKWKGVGTSSGGAFNIAGIGRLYSVTPSSLNSSAVVRERMGRSRVRFFVDPRAEPPLLAIQHPYHINQWTTQRRFVNSESTQSQEIEHMARGSSCSTHPPS